MSTGLEHRRQFDKCMYMYMYVAVSASRYARLCSWLHWIKPPQGPSTQCSELHFWTSQVRVRRELMYQVDGLFSR